MGTKIMQSVGTVSRNGVIFPPTGMQCTEFFTARLAI
jgi:hypothetical protein